jgi:hypothetical protein
MVAAVARGGGGRRRTPVWRVGVAAVTGGKVILAPSSRAVVRTAATYVGSGIPVATINALAKKALSRA